MAAHDEIINILSREDLLEQDKEWLVTLILKLLEQSEQSEQIQTKNTNDWGWEEITEEFEEINDVSRASRFLRKILEKKIIYTDKKDPIFDSLLDIDMRLEFLRQKYDSVFDLETAEKKFNYDLNKLEKWKKLYNTIKTKLVNAYNEITKTGITAENTKKNFYLMRNFIQKHSIEILDHCDDVTYDLKSGAILDNTVKADNQILAHDDFKDYGNDIFKERRKEINDNKQKRSKKENLTKKDMIDVLNKTIQRRDDHDRKSH